MSSMMASGSSERGSSFVRTAKSASSPATRPMPSRRPGSRSPAQPKTAMRRPSSCDTQHLEDVPQGVGRGGDVDDDAEGLAAVDHLHAAGHALEGAEPVGDLPPARRRARGRRPRRRGHRRRCSGRAAAGGRAAGPNGPTRSKVECKRFETQVLGAEVGRGVDGVGHGLRPRAGAKRCGGGVVGVEDGGLGDALVDAFVEHLEQAALGGEVAGEVAVEVEVVAAEGREDGDIELALVEAVEGEAVRGGLDDGVATAAGDHARERSPALRATGRWSCGWR